MATTIANLGAPAPTGNLLIVDGLNVAFRWKHQNIYIGPTVYSVSNHSHFHANMIAPNIHTYAAWGLRSQNFDQISLWKKCMKNCDGCIWNLENAMPNCEP